jgi:SAM-dependent methyltransferase
MSDIKKINIQTRKCYNKIADKYFDLFKNELTEKEFDRDLLDGFAGYFNRDSLICDAGCGPITHTGRYLSDKGLNVIGTDISDRSIEIAKTYNPGMKFIRTDFFEWDFPEKYLDGILSFYSIMYTPKEFINDLIKIFHKALKPNGKLLLVVKEGINEGYVKEILSIKTRAYETYFTEQEIKEYLLNNGFDIKYFYMREPINTEINIKRIYAIAEKKV